MVCLVPPMQPQESVPLSVVTTLYRSAPFIDEFYRRMSAAASASCADYEIVIVNDGSPDNSLQLALRLAEQDERIRVVDFSRNFGHHAAIMAGLRHARGRLVFLIDIDLEERPEWLVDFWEDLHREGVDMVYGVQERRVGGVWKRATGGLFYKLFNAVSDTSIPESACTVRLMTRDYVNAVTQTQEVNLFLAGIFAWFGFSQRARTVRKEARQGTTYTLRRLLSLFIHAITSFSSYPLYLVFLAGTVITGLATLYGVYLIVDKLLHPDAIMSGFTSLMASLWFLGGLIISFLGLIGIYLGKLFAEVKGRPQYVVRRVYEKGAALETGASGNA